MNCTRHMVGQGKRQQTRKASCNIKKSTGVVLLSLVILLTERSLKQIKNGVMRPLISAGALLGIIGMVGGMEQGTVSPVAALPICLALILGTLALVKE